MKGVTHFEHLIDFRISRLSYCRSYPRYAHRGPLLIISIDQNNNHVLGRIPTSLHGQLSSNRLVNNNPKDIAEVTPSEYFEAVYVPGVPRHMLDLKTASALMFIRDVNFDAGIVNSPKRHS